MSLTKKRVIQEVLDTLYNMRTLLTPKEHWIQGDYAHNAAGRLVPPKSDTATCWCLMGALHKYSPHGGVYQQIECRLLGIINNNGRNEIGVIRYNDSHLHGAVLELLDVAIQDTRCELRNAQ